jgi:hypothetical protein
VVAGILAGDDRKGILIADNAFTDEPVRPYVLEELRNLLVEAGRLLGKLASNATGAEPRRTEVAGWIASAGTPPAANGDDLKKVLEQICSQGRLLLGAASVVIYPMDKGSISYMTEKIASAGLESWQSRPSSRDHVRVGLNAHIRRVGRVLIPDVCSSPLVFDDVPLQRRGFIQRHNVRAFVGRSLQAHATNDPLGVLFVNYATVHPFDRHHEEFGRAAGRDSLSVDRACTWQRLSWRISIAPRIEPSALYFGGCADARRRRQQGDWALLANAQNLLLCS